MNKTLVLKLMHIKYGTDNVCQYYILNSRFKKQYSSITKSLLSLVIETMWKSFILLFFFIHLITFALSIFHLQAGWKKRPTINRNMLYVCMTVSLSLCVSVRVKYMKKGNETNEESDNHVAFIM